MKPKPRFLVTRFKKDPSVPARDRRSGWGVFDTANPTRAARLYPTRAAALAAAARRNRPPVTYDIQRSDRGRWHGDVGESTEWPTLEAARDAVRGLLKLGPDYHGDYRIIEHDSRTVIEEISLV